MIRSAVWEDEEKIAKLIGQFRVDLKQLKGIAASPDLKQGIEEFKEYSEAGYPIFVYEDHNKELLGYLVCRVDGGVVWAESLFVLHNARRSGIASKLYEKAEELAQKLGESMVYNYVHPNNDKIIRFLAKRGYNVLNLIEIRKPRENEAFTEKIKVGKHEYDY